MCAHKIVEPRSTGTRVETVLTWLGGGQRHEPGEHPERSGVIVVLNAALAWLVATLAVTESVRWSMWAVLPLTLTFGLLVGAITRAIAGGPMRNRSAIVGRSAVAIAVGVVVGQFAAMAVFSGSIDHHLDEQAAHHADATPAVAVAATELQRIRTTRTTLDDAVGTARTHRDEALVVARCEYHPSPACPQTRITGVPGAGPEARTANQLLADARQELETAISARDRRVPALDSQIDAGTATLAQARQAAIANADRGFSARWVAMHDLTSASPGALLLRLVTIAFFVIIGLLPLILRLWRGETTNERHAAAHAKRDHAELAADVAIVVKREEVRAAVETMWADHQLTQARLAIEAQAEIDRAQQHRRVIVALEGAPPVAPEAIEAEMYLPLAAEAEAASLAVAELPAAKAPAPEPPNLPAVARSTPLIPTIPDVTKTALRWTRPLVSTFVARAIDTTTQPLRLARQVFEEVEEITFAFRRTRKVTVGTEETAVQHDGDPDRGSVGTVVVRDTDPVAVGPGEPLHPIEPGGPAELAGAAGPSRLGAGEGPRQLPPAG